MRHIPIRGAHGICALVVSLALASTSLANAQPIALPPASNLLPPDATLDARVITIERLATGDSNTAVAAYRACNFTRGDLFAASFRKRWYSIETIYGAADSVATLYPLTLSGRTLMQFSLASSGYSIAKSRVLALLNCLPGSAKTYSDDDIIDASVMAHEEAEFSRKTCDPAKPAELGQYKRHKADLGTAATEIERRAATAKGDRKKRLTEAAKIAREREGKLPAMPEGGPCPPKSPSEGN